jgi:cell wall-associated NlpC family hydrolase
LLSHQFASWRRYAVAAASAGALAVGAAPASAQTGGAPAPGSGSSSTSGVPGVATLLPNGKALAPAGAPRNVRKAINAANRIRKKPYRWGGGHRRWKDKGYDCSGAVSYVLHAAGLLKRPLPSGPLARSWGSRGRGQWITVYANRGHVYAVIAGLRWDTSAVGESVRAGSGPRWRITPRSPSGYKARFYPSL